MDDRTAGAVNVRIPETVRRSMIDHARDCLPEEACGLLVGSPGVVSRFVPIENVEHSSVGFTLDPEGHYRVVREAEANGEHILGVVHSHTGSAPVPSGRDMAMAMAPGWLQLIIGLAATPTMLAWAISDGDVVEVTIEA